MIIVGGTYRETVVVPESEELMGSGVRAAAALSSTAAPPVLHTAVDVDEDLAEEADLVARALGVTRTTVQRTEPVGFRYFTPISSPAVNGPSAKLCDPGSLKRYLSSQVRQFDGQVFCSSGWGWLIQDCSGIFGGTGRRANRSGCVA